jgi:hypothetical protein
MSEGARQKLWDLSTGARSVRGVYNIDATVLQGVEIKGFFYVDAIVLEGVEIKGVYNIDACPCRRRPPWQCPSRPCAAACRGTCRPWGRFYETVSARINGQRVNYKYVNVGFSRFLVVINPRIFRLTIGLQFWDILIHYFRIYGNLSKKLFGRNGVS